MSITDDLRKLAMAGLGAATVAAEKTQEAIETLSKRGEETLEQGKTLNEQLHHDVESSIKDHAETVQPDADLATVLAALERMSPENLDAVRTKLASLSGNEHTNG